MVFLYPQTRHSLIPQTESDRDNLALATETKSFRREFFGLLAQKIAEISAKYADLED